MSAAVPHVRRSRNRVQIPEIELIPVMPACPAPWQPDALKLE